MNLVLARIDDRLIHGQVTVGWGQKLAPDHILLANDEVAADPWQARVYAGAVPPEIKVSVLSVAAAARVLREPEQLEMLGRKVFLLTESASDMHDVVAAGAPVGRVNVGGMHFSRGKRELITSVYADRRDLAALRAMAERGLEISAQAVPGGYLTVLEPSLLSEFEARL